jgi:hypothetical protein
VSPAVDELIHSKNMAMSTWVWPSARPCDLAASMRNAFTRPEAFVPSAFHREAWYPLHAVATAANASKIVAMTSKRLRRVLASTCVASVVMPGLPVDGWWFSAN